MANVEPCMPWHVTHIGENMRQADADEIRALGLEPMVGVWQAFRASSHAWTLRVNGEPVCVFGLVPTNLLGRTALIWLLGTDGVPSNARSFVAACRPSLEKCLELYDHLYNWVDVRHSASLRWLKWMGFEFSDPAPHGMLGMPFRRFDMRKA